MSILTIDNQITNGTGSDASQITAAATSIETFFNVTKLSAKNIKNLGIAADNIAADAITNAKLGDLIISGSAIASSAVTGAKIAANTISDTRRVARTLNQTGADPGADGVVTSQVLTQTFTTTSFVTVTNSGVTLTTTGRPILLGLMPFTTTGTTGSEIRVGIGTATSVYFEINLRRGGTQVCSWRWDVATSRADGAVSYFPGGAVFIDDQAAGTYSWDLQGKLSTSTGSPTGTITQCCLVALEI